MDESLSSPSESKLPLILAAVALAAGITGLLFGWSARSKISALQNELSTATTQAADAKVAADAARNSTGMKDAQIAQLQSDLADLNQKTGAAFGKVETTLLNFRRVIESGNRTTRPPVNTGATTGQTGGTATAVAVAADEYVIKARDTFTTIARQHGVRVTDIEAVNPGVDSSKLKIGQKIKLPAKR